MKRWNDSDSISLSLPAHLCLTCFNFSDHMSTFCITSPLAWVHPWPSNLSRLSTLVFFIDWELGSQFTDLKVSEAERSESFSWNNIVHLWGIILLCLAVVSLFIVTFAFGVVSALFCYRVSCNPEVSFNDLCCWGWPRTPSLSAFNSQDCK